MSLEQLLARAQVWRAGSLPAAGGHPSGFTVLDAVLPGGGWPRSGLTEILSDVPGIGAVRLLLPALAALSRAGHWVVWIAPPYLPFAPALVAQGFELERLLVVELPPPSAPRQALWAFEQALRFSACGAALCWSQPLGERALRRLQLAAESGATWGLVFREHACAARPSPAPLRLLLEPVKGREAALQVTVHKARGGPAGRACVLEL